MSTSLAERTEQAFEGLNKRENERAYRAINRHPQEHHGRLLEIITGMSEGELKGWVALNTQRYTLPVLGRALGSQDLEQAWREGAIQGRYNEDNIQMSSWEPTLSEEAYWIRREGEEGFRAHKRTTIRELIEGMPNRDKKKVDLAEEPQIISPGESWLVRFNEKIIPRNEERIISSTKSSIGRLFQLSRLLTDGQDSYDKIMPTDYETPLEMWGLLEPRVWKHVINPGNKVLQLRHFTGLDPKLSELEIKNLYESGAPLLTYQGRPVSQDMMLHLDLLGEHSDGVVGLRARQNPEPIDLSARNYYDVLDYWEPVRARKGKIQIHKNEYWLMNSLETLQTLPYINMQMQRFSSDSFIGINDFAGFIDQNFRRQLVFEIESHEESKQTLRHESPIGGLDPFFSGLTLRQYGEGSHYTNQSGPQPPTHFKKFEWESI